MKEIIINGGLACVTILLCSLLVGHFVVKTMKMRTHIFRNIVYGFVFLGAIFELLSLICIKFNLKFHVLYYSYIVIVVILVLTSLIAFLYTKQYKQYLKRTNIKNYLYLGLILTIIAISFQMFQSSYMHHTDADDGYFITISNIAVEKDEINLMGDSVYNGGDSYSQSVRSDTFSWELFVATIAKTFNIHPAVLCHSVFPAFLIFICYLSIFEVGKKLIFNKKKLYIFMFFMALLNIFGGYAVYSSGCFLLLRIWQGKAMIVNFAFPMLIANCINIYRKRDNIFTWIFNALIVVVGMGFSTVGIYLMPIAYLIIGIPYIINRIFKKDFKRVFNVLKYAIITMLHIAVFDIYMFFSITGSANVEKYMQRSASKWVDIFDMTMMRESYFVLLLLSCVYLLAKKRKKIETILLVGMTCGLFATFLNPYFTEFVAQRVTGVDVYWRLYWILPVYILIAYVLSDIIYKERRFIGIVCLCGTLLMINYAGKYMYGEDLYFTDHSNKYKILEEVVKVCELIGVDEKEVTCLFPESLAYYPRQYSSNINVIKARNINGNMSLIPNTDYSYDYLYDKVYESCDIDSNEISKLLKDLNVEYIYTRTPIETYEFSLYSILEEYGGYLYKANQYMFEVSNIIDEDAIANGMKEKGVILSKSISDEIKKYNTELRVSYERNNLSEMNNSVLNLKVNSIIDEDVLDAQALAYYAYEGKYPYLVYKSDLESKTKILEAGYIFVADVGNYSIFRLVDNTMADTDFLITQYGDSEKNQQMFYTIQDHNGHLVVIDGGWMNGADEVRTVITNLGNHVDAWILTHPHEDHIGAFCEIYDDLREIKINKIYTVDMATPQLCMENASWDNVDMYNRFSSMSIEQLEYVHAGDIIQVGNLNIDILSTYEDKIDELSNDLLNDGSMMFKVNGQNESMLFCADVGKKLSDYLLSEYGEKLKSDYLQMGHHGNGGLKEDFYKVVNPKIAFFDAPNWLMYDTTGRFTTPNNKLLMENMGCTVISISTAPNSIIIR